MNYLLLKPNGVFEKIGATEPTCSLSLLQKKRKMAMLRSFHGYRSFMTKESICGLNDEGKLLNLIPLP